MWCPQCAAEYRPGFTYCSDCDRDLVTERPLPPPAPPTAVADHDLVEYDLVELTAEQADLLALLLGGADIPFRWEPTRRLVVARAVADDVDEILDFVDASAGAIAAPADDSGAPPATARLAGSWRRVGGAVIDGVVLLVPTWVLQSAFRTAFAAWAAVAVMRVAYDFLLIALWGRTPGKLALRMRVETLDRRSPPGFRAAAIRAAVPALGDPVIAVAYIAPVPLRLAIAILATLWSVVVYAPVLRPDHRGLHDIAAGTVVVRDEDEPRRRVR